MESDCVTNGSDSLTNGVGFRPNLVEIGDIAQVEVRDIAQEVMLTIT